MMEYDKVAFFDGVCTLCNGIVQFFLKHDKREVLTFAPIQSETALKILHSHGKNASHLDTFYYLRNGKVLDRSSAVIYALNDIGGMYKIAIIFIVVPPFIRNAAYNFVAKNRYAWFGQKDACMIPTPEIMKRFLP